MIGTPRPKPEASVAPRVKATPGYKVFEDDPDHKIQGHPKQQGLNKWHACLGRFERPRAIGSRAVPELSG